ncbi:4a-hydroxytetrahydrobiopterin dehydratase [Brumimicrobium salinarum]|nr:4a-hydroxytetrahydrobiopterin dehydratase [Brumimicrobium salinarum]
MNWSKKNNQLEKSYVMDDFKQAIQFVNKVADLAEQKEHHPSIHIHSYKNVDIRLTTHDQGNKVTEIDQEMSREIDEIKKQM